MTNSIVVFGKAQSGKSTLLGYLYSQMKKDFNINDFEQNLKFELGMDYEPSYLYAYIMDESKYERTRKKGTRNMHVRRIAFNNRTNVTVIDTPGAEHHEIPKQRGAFLGDVGVFCLEIKDVISDDFMQSSKENATIFSSLLLWSNLGHKSIIVALTKFDEVNYSEECYRIARDRVNFLCGNTKLDNVITIPISILVSHKTGDNIIRKSEKASWYTGKYLHEAIIERVNKLPHTNKGRLLFSIYNQIDNPSSKAGKIWMAKILQGTISVNDQIILSPVLNKNREFVSIFANVKTLRYDLHDSEEAEAVTTAEAGEIVGIDINHIYEGKEKIDKKSFDSIYTTCGFDKGTNYITSDIFCFSTKEAYENVFKLNREFSLIWFGRKIAFSVYKPPQKNGDRIIITGRIKSRKITLPIQDNGEYYFSKLIIKDNNIKSDPYYEGVLLRIGEEL